MKIIDILNQCYESGKHCLSFEYYPPRDRSKWQQFYEKIDRMGKLHPNFIDVTWGTGDPTSMATLEISRTIQERTHIDTMMHLTCTNRSRQELIDILNHVRQETSIRNVMALRGNRSVDTPWAPHPEGFRHASELIAAIREHFGAAFSISAAGYPEGHREDGIAPDPAFVRTAHYETQLDHLKEKIDAGADFIVTQLCFDLDRLCQYRDDCARHGIFCPIIPGILPIHSQQTWEKIAAFSASIPENIKRRYAEVPANDSEALASFAIALLHEQIDFLHAHGFFAVHLYTLNHEKLISKALGVI